MTTNWISVKDKNNCIINETILISDGYDVYPGFLDSMHNWRMLNQDLCTDIGFDVLFWQPLPDAPPIHIIW